MRRLISILLISSATFAVALAGSAGTANASATIDLIWANTGTNQIGGVESSSTITLQVILTAGPAGSMGGGVSVDYSDVLGMLTVSGYMSTPDEEVTDPLPLVLSVTEDTGSRIQNINSGSFIPGSIGTGLMAGQSKQLGTVKFHKSGFSDGTFEIRSDANGPVDGILDFEGYLISSTTTFNSAFLCDAGGSCPTPMPTAPPTSTPSTVPTPEPSPWPSAEPNARIDLIWNLNGSDAIAEVPDGSDVRLNVILTAGYDGVRLALVSVDYSQVSGLSVVSFANTPSIGRDSPLPGVDDDETIDTGTRVETINSISFPPVGTGLSAGESHQLGTVTFHKSADVGNGTFEITSDADSLMDAILDLDGDNVTFMTTFNSAHLINRVPSPTPTAMLTPAVQRSACSVAWPLTTIVTEAKGQSPTNNAKLTHTIHGNIIDPDSVSETGHRVRVCAGTEVVSAVSDSTGTPTNTATGSLECLSSGCSGVVNAREGYRSISADGDDRDAITFIPQ